MKFEIKNRFTGAVLFALETESLKLTVEAAVKSGADLRGAYLRGADLGGADLCGADLRGAYLRGANLTKKLRTRKITEAQLIEWNACVEGRAWVKENIGDSVSCADLYAHGKDGYLVWLEGRVLIQILKEG